MRRAWLLRGVVEGSGYLARGTKSVHTTQLGPHPCIELHLMLCVILRA